MSLVCVLRAWLVTSKHIFSGLQHLESALTGVQLVANWTDWGSKHLFCLTVPALREFVVRDLSPQGVFEISAFVTCECWKNPIPVAPAQCHKLAGLWLEASHIFIRDQKHGTHYAILTAYAAKVFALSVLGSEVWAHEGCTVCAHCRDTCGAHSKSVL